MDNGTQNIVYTRMLREHLDDIARLERLCFDDEAWSKRLFEEEMGENRYYVVALESGKIIGYGGYAQILDEAHIMNIAVSPEFRRRGIGGGILRILLSRAKEGGALTATLEVKRGNEEAAALYEKNGFAVSGCRKKYYKNTHDALIYLKQL